MTEAAAAMQGKRLASRYTLLDKLGAGGQGEVWRAHDSKRGVDIALKVVNPTQSRADAWQALEHESTIAGLLDHPSILKVFAPDRSGDLLVLPMELASGGDLRRLRGAGFLEIIPVLLEIAQALEHAHDRGVVHRDLKPGNVLFDARGRARLADFGVAETAAGVGSNGAAPETARETNKPGFSPFTASPAQLRGEPPKPADDIYGLGALAYELLSGYPPYYPHFDRRRAIEEPVPDLVPTRQIPPLLSALVMRMLSKDPAERPRSMREVIDELDAALNDTLTYDFDSSSDSDYALSDSGTAHSRHEASLAAELPALFASAELAANMPDGPPGVPEWTPDSGVERRATPDRRIQRTAFLPTPDVVGSSASSNTAVSTSPKNGAASKDEAAERRAAPAVRAASESRTDAASDIRRPRMERHAAVSTPARSTATRESTVLREAPIKREAAAKREVPATREPPAAREPASARGATARHEPTTVSSDAPAGVILEAPRAPAAPDRTRETDTAVRILREPRTSPQALSDSQSRNEPEARWMRAGPPSGAQATGGQVGPMHAHRASDALHAVGDPTSGTNHGPSGASDLSIPSVRHHPSWNAIPLDGLPRVARLEPIRARRWPWVVVLLAAAAIAGYLWLPSVDPEVVPTELSRVMSKIQVASGPADSSAGGGTRTPSSAVTPSASPQSGPPPAQTQPAAVTQPMAGPIAPASASTAAAAVDAASTAAPATIGAAQTPESRFVVLHRTLESRLNMLETRGAGVWGGADFSLAKNRVAQAAAAHDAGDVQLATDRLGEAGRMLDNVEARAPQALSAEIAAGEKALGAGQQEVAGQAFNLARRIDPRDRRATDGQRRAQSLNGVLPLLADAENAEVERDYARAAQDYSQALALDPGNTTARAGQARANAAFGDDSYAQAVGTGFAALGAGRLDEAREAFVKARALKPNGAEAMEGLRRVGAALTARGFASIRQRASGLEAQERWDEAEQAYDDVLKADPSLAFAREGKARAASRSELASRLQDLIDRPAQLASPSSREEARSLLETAQAQAPSGPVLRSQIARLQILLPGFDKPVRLSLLSDNSTLVTIDSVGSFGAFSRREIQLKPGKYTVVGTRSGFRDVRREITVAPGQETQTIRVSCSEPI